MRTDPDVQYVVAAFDLALPKMSLSGKSGELLGRGTGSSLEFHEYREYTPGDDIRHLDWQAFARTDQLMVRLFRNEVSPNIEVVLDTSCSMNTGRGAKSLVAKQLAAAMMLLAAKLGGRPRLLLLGDDWPVQQLRLEDLESLQTLTFESLRSMSETLQVHSLPARQQSVRIVISDFLFPHDADALVNQLTAGASGAWFVQLLTDWEAAPTAIGGRHLVDVETGWELDLMVDEAAVAGYAERMTRMQHGLQMAGRRRMAGLVTATVDSGLRQACRTQLVRNGLLTAH